MPSSCAASYNVSFTAAKYVTTGGNPVNLYDRTSNSVGAYEYVLPSGVTPVSGLTLVSGSTYKGTNNFTIVPKPIGQTVIQVRALNDGSCTGTFQKGAISYLYLNPPTLSVAGPSTIRCGETDTKTFTINNGVSGGCLTYTWQVANKGWKDASGNPITSDVVTTTPSLQLVSGDNSAAPPQSFSVVVTAGSASVTINKTVSYLTPYAALPLYAANYGLNCDEVTLNAVIVNPPVNSYNLSWTTTNGYEINSNASPFSSGADPEVIITKVGTSASEIKVSIVGSCGTVLSNGIGFEGCLPWSGVTSVYANYPMHPEPLTVTVTTDEGDMWWLNGYEWYLQTGSGYTPIGNAGYGLTLSTYEWPCDPKSLYIRAVGFYGASPLKYVTDVYGMCGARMAGTKKDVIKVYPNPTVDDIVINYTAENSSYTIRIADLQGNLQLQQLVKVESKTDGDKVAKNNKINIGKLKKGKYIIVIQDGKKTYSKIIEKV